MILRCYLYSYVHLKYFKQDCMEEIAEEVIYKSNVYLKIIDDLEKSGLRVSVKVDGEIFILLLTWGKWMETDNEES